jgi:hypothetical protein
MGNKRRNHQENVIFDLCSVVLIFELKFIGMVSFGNQWSLVTCMHCDIKTIDNIYTGYSGTNMTFWRIMIC